MSYDPLRNDFPDHQPWPDSYWATTVTRPEPLPALNGRVQTDVAIVGGGFTGLLTAYYLASEFNIEARVLEANQIGFGASGRNAGFVLKGSGRMGYSQMAKKWGMETTRGIYDEFSQAVRRVEQLIKQHDIACDPRPKGYLKIAHNAKAYGTLKAAANFIAEHLGDDAEFLTPSELKAVYMDNHQAYGALRLNDGFGVNPLKLCLGYKRAVQSLGVPLHEESCVRAWLKEGAHHRLVTDKGELIAKQVVSAGNAYTPKHFNPAVDSRYLPILSNIIVTAPLSEAQLEATGLKTHQVVMDTRRLKYYYRLLGDNRLLFGGRGAISGKDARDPRYGERLKSAMADCFPALTDIAIDHNWTGWIAAALDDMPHVYSKGDMGYSLGYCGAGVAFSAQAAYRLAQHIAGERLPELPLYRTPLPKFPFARLRRLGQSAYYQYAWLRDRYS
ncbi:FAD-binding oxidoreductase [Shewanella sp. Isolate8]|uniref:NAD(P)/FAD-dependent oxidoreductase n=1 Tax=Shewanella sp. Isolate8 TaxID=2908529 RepID=UPI001EFCF5CF|nr:FAD-binding oxidoreductase [Shewanella sp. Isolate8]MCG9746522.1 FAD-binding oxidoreductase [Shewanella sp. Isolate8]